MEKVWGSGRRMSRSIGRGMGMETWGVDEAFLQGGGGGGSRRGSRGGRARDDDEEALRWAAIERLPTYSRMRTSILAAAEAAAGAEGGRQHYKEVDVRKLAVGVGGVAALAHELGQLRLGPATPRGTPARCRSGRRGRTPRGTPRGTPASPVSQRQQFKQQEQPAPTTNGKAAVAPAPTASWETFDLLSSMPSRSSATATTTIAAATTTTTTFGTGL